jgi:hypothetical protein
MAVRESRKTNEASGSWDVGDLGIFLEMKFTDAVVMAVSHTEERPSLVLACMMDRSAWRRRCGRGGPVYIIYRVQYLFHTPNNRQLLVD